MTGLFRYVPQIEQAWPDLDPGVLQLLAERDRQLEDYVSAGGGGAPTVFVAASDASERSRQRADFVAPGTDDFVFLEGIIDDMVAEGYGGRLLLSEGQFNGEAGYTWAIPYSVLVQGMGWQTTYLVVPGNTVGIQVDDMAIFRDCAVLKDGGGGVAVQLTGDHAVCEGLWVEGTPTNTGIQQAAGYTTVRGCHVRSCLDGFEVSSDGLLEGCVAQLNKARGIYLDNAAAAAVIRGNRVIGGDASGNDVGIDMDGARSLVHGNSVRGVGQHGIVCEGADNAILDNFVYGCGQKTNNTYDGIRIAADKNNVQGNTVRHGGGASQHKYGINVNGGTSNLVTNNDLVDGGSTANFVDTGTTTVTTAGNRV